MRRDSIRCEFQAMSNVSPLVRNSPPFGTVRWTNGSCVMVNGWSLVSVTFASSVLVILMMHLSDSTSGICHGYALSAAATEPLMVIQLTPLSVEYSRRTADTDADASQPIE